MTDEQERVTVEITIGKGLGIDEQPDPARIDAICRPIVDYHRALETRDLALLASSVCEAVYRVYCGATDRLADWEPWPRLTRERILANFGHAFESGGFYYENRLEFAHVMLNGQEAFVRTLETGRTWKDRSWRDAEVLWHSTHTGGDTWRIAGHIHHLA